MAMDYHTPHGEGSYITVTHGMSGYFAVWIHVNRVDHAPDTFEEPWDTGFGRYATREEAEAEARIWAKLEGLPFK